VESYLPKLKFLALLLAIPLAAQQRYISSDVELGSRLYRANCFVCHGPDGDSIPGVDFRRGQFKRASSDADLFRVITGGVPGTAMPPTAFSDGQRYAVVAYLRSLHDSAQSAVGSGDANRGRALFEGKGGCQACHRVNGNGSRVGPDLSEVGSIRGAEYLERSLVAPEESVLPEHRFVRVVTRQGTVFTGRRLNEDTQTIQMIDTEERLHSFTKSDLRELTLLTTTTMPSYKEKLSGAEVADVVTYLLSLKGLDSQ
jgi:putative heme-binding domain-containing protein